MFSLPVISEMAFFNNPPSYAQCKLAHAVRTVRQFNYSTEYGVDYHAYRNESTPYSVDFAVAAQHQTGFSSCSFA